MGKLQKKGENEKKEVKRTEIKKRVHRSWKNKMKTGKLNKLKEYK